MVSARVCSHVNFQGLHVSTMDNVNAKPIIPWKFLAAHSSSSSHLSSSSPTLPQKKTFAQALNNACDIPLSQLLVPCMKGDGLAVKIPEDEYKACLEGCKNNLHGRLLLSKGDSPIKHNNPRAKLLNLWKPLGHWKVVPIGKRVL